MMQGRIAWPTRDDITEDQESTYSAIVNSLRTNGSGPSRVTDSEGRLQGPFNAMLLDPVVGVAVQDLGVALRYSSTLSDRERELATLLVAASAKSNYEWCAHERLALTAGLSEQEIAAILEGREPASLNEHEKAVWQVTTALLVDRDLSDSQFAAAEEQLGLPQLFDLVALVGYYELLARSLRVFRTPVAAGSTEAFPS